MLRRCLYNIRMDSDEAMAFDRKTLVIPDYTQFKEKTIKTKGDVVIGDRSMLRFGIETDGRIFVGEHAVIDGDLHTKDDIRVDIFSNIGGNINSGGNAYLGEKVHVKGKLSLKGDLDVGDSVDIDKGFEAKGWINIRSPIPVVIYIFIYLMQLLKMGKSEEIERLLEELEDNNGETIPISETFLFIPNNTIMAAQKSQSDYSLRIGKQCKVLGNFSMKGTAYVDEDSEVYGSIHTTGDIYCGKNVVIHGAISTTGNIHLSESCHVIGEVKGDAITLSKSATIEGTLHAKQGTTFTDAKKEQAKEKVTRFETNTDIVDEMQEMLE